MAAARISGCHAVQIAGSQTAQTAVAQTGVRLHVEDVRRFEAQLTDGGGQGLQQRQIEGVFHQAAASQNSATGSG